MIERLQAIENRYNELSTELIQSGTISNIKRTLELTKEQSLLSEAYEIYQEYKKILAAIEEANDMIRDPEMGEIAREELIILEQQKGITEQQIEVILLPKDPNDGKNVILEIRGAAGGDEANIFAGNLYRMYTRYAERVGWKISVLNEEYGVSGGFCLVEFMIKGDNVYSKLKYESGAHRVQRVPATETQGRVHTSTATVLVMPEVEEFDVDVKMSDLRVDVYRSGGCGGQGVNTTDSAVRMTHIPTGIMVICQNERSQIQNREQALKIIRARIYDDQLRKYEEIVGNERKNKIGTGDRSEKIRTYNYPQNRVTDHRIGFTLKQLDRVMDGALEEIIEALVAEDQARKLKGE